MPARNGVARRGICGRHTAFWPQISTKNIFGSGRCTGMDPEGKGGIISAALSGRLSDDGDPGVNGMQEQLDHYPEGMLRSGLPTKVIQDGGPNNETSHPGDRTGYGLPRLPEQKLAELQSVLGTWARHKAATKRQLLSLIGRLAHACRVVVAGRTFLSRMINLAMRRTRLNAWVHLDAAFRSDMAWWDCFIGVWNARSMIELFSDM